MAVYYYKPNPKMKSFLSMFLILFISVILAKTQTCQPSIIINRGTGYDLGFGAVFDTIGFQALLDYNGDHWCVQDGYITNINNGLVLDIFEQNIVAKQIVLWTRHGSNNADQYWIITLETTGFWSIVSVIENLNLALAAVNQYDYTQGLTLKTLDINDVSQQWTLAPQ